MNFHELPSFPTTSVDLPGLCPGPGGGRQFYLFRKRGGISGGIRVEGKAKWGGPWIWGTGFGGQEQGKGGEKKGKGQSVREGGSEKEQGARLPPETSSHGLPPTKPPFPPTQDGSTGPTPLSSLAAKQQTVPAPLGR